HLPTGGPLPFHECTDLGKRDITLPVDVDRVEVLGDPWHMLRGLFARQAPVAAHIGGGEVACQRIAPRGRRCSALRPLIRTLRTLIRTLLILIGVRLARVRSRLLITAWPAVRPRVAVRVRWVIVTV